MRMGAAQTRRRPNRRECTLGRPVTEGLPEHARQGRSAARSDASSRRGGQCGSTRRSERARQRTQRARPWGVLPVALPQAAAHTNAAPPHTSTTGGCSSQGCVKSVPSPRLEGSRMAARMASYSARTAWKPASASACCRRSFSSAEGCVCGLGRWGGGMVGGRGRGRRSGRRLRRRQSAARQADGRWS